MSVARCVTRAGAYFATVISADVGRRFDDLQGAMSVMRVVGSAVLQVDATLERTAHLGTLARYPLVHGNGAVAEEPLHNEALLFVRRQHVFTIQHDGLAATLHRRRHFN